MTRQDVSINSTLMKRQRLTIKSSAKKERVKTPERKMDGAGNVLRATSTQPSFYEGEAFPNKDDIDRSFLKDGKVRAGAHRRPRYIKEHYYNNITPTRHSPTSGFNSVVDRHLEMNVRQYVPKVDGRISSEEYDREKDLYTKQQVYYLERSLPKHTGRTVYYSGNRKEREMHQLMKAFGIAALVVLVLLVIVAWF